MLLYLNLEGIILQRVPCLVDRRVFPFETGETGETGAGGEVVIGRRTRRCFSECLSERPGKPAAWVAGGPRVQWWWKCAGSVRLAALGGDYPEGKPGHLQAVKCSISSTAPKLPSSPASISPSFLSSTRDQALEPLLFAAHSSTGTITPAQSTKSVAVPSTTFPRPHPKDAVRCATRELVCLPSLGPAARTFLDPSPCQACCASKHWPPTVRSFPTACRKAAAAAEAAAAAIAPTPSQPPQPTPASTRLPPRVCPVASPHLNPTQSIQSNSIQ